MFLSLFFSLIHFHLLKLLEVVCKIGLQKICKILHLSWDSRREVGPLEVPEKFRVVWHKRLYGWHKRLYGGLLENSVTPVQSESELGVLSLELGVGSWTGLRLDFHLTIG